MARAVRLEAAVEDVHDAVWQRFVDPEFGTFYDYAGLDGRVILPTAEDCAAARPNALAWWTPIENGAFFGGLYLASLCRRLEITGRGAAETHKIADGLLRLARVGSTPGFIARGLSRDGRGHPPAGSDDQSFPWFYGLFHYARASFVEADRRNGVIATMAEVAEALEGYGWRMPCDRAGFGFRGEWTGGNFVHAARLLFVLRTMADLTGEGRWEQAYRRALAERPEGDRTRLEWCADGAGYGPPGSRTGYPCNPPFWISASSQAALRVLLDLETDGTVAAAYQAGLLANARAAAAHVARYRLFDPADDGFCELDWRFLSAWWEPQRTIADAVRVAERQAGEWFRRSPRRVLEGEAVREPLWAAWIVALAGPHRELRAAREEFGRALGHYRWTQLYTSPFFIAENAGWQWLADGER